MNKSILIIAGLLIANQSFADITATNGAPDAATCDSGALGSDSGGVALQVQYIPETIALQWYDSNTLLDVTSTNSDSCTYNTSINLPANPTKIGYKFTGWKVRPLYDFSNLNVYTDGYMRYAIGTYDGVNTCWKRISENNASTGYGNCSNNTYKDLQQNEFKALFNFGTVYGMGLCSATSGTQSVAGTPNKSVRGGHCWCKVTGYIPNGSSEKYAPLNSVPWMYWENLGTSVDCDTYCANSCSNALTSVRASRVVMYGQSNY